MAAGAVAGVLDLLPGASDLKPEFLPGVALGHGEEAVGRLREFLEKRNLELREEKVDASVGASGERVRRLTKLDRRALSKALGTLYIAGELRSDTEGHYWLAEPMVH